MQELLGIQSSELKEIGTLISLRRMVSVLEALRTGQVELTEAISLVHHGDFNRDLAHRGLGVGVIVKASQTTTAKVEKGQGRAQTPV